MFDWKILAIATPLLFAIYQSLSKLLPKDTSVFLVNAYASLIGFVIMIVLHLFTSSNKSFFFSIKYLPLVVSIGFLISLGNYGIIKAYSSGAPQSLFAPLFYVCLILYGVLLGLFFWQEKFNIIQSLGIILSITGLLMTLYFRK